MSLELFGHPFSSYTWKVLIPLWTDGTAFDFRNVDPAYTDNGAEFARIAPFGQFPLLRDNGRVIAESTCIIEHLQAHHPSGSTWIPKGENGLKVRFLDRVFDLRVMAEMQVPVSNAIRPEANRDPYGVERALGRLRAAYDWLEANLGEGPWAIGDRFTLADCAAAPALFYADWVEEIGAGRPRLTAYRARLLAHPVVARVVDQARPYRGYFPLGAPDRD